MVVAHAGWEARRFRWNLGPRGWSDLDWPLILITLALAVFGVLTVYSITLDDPRYESAAPKQIVWLVVGIVVAVAMLTRDYRFYLRHAYLLYALVAALLVLTFVIGARHKGVQRWIAIPGVPIRMQPSELAKLAVVLVLARYLGTRKRPVAGLFDTLPALALVAPVFALILKQPDLGTALVFLPIIGGMLYVAGFPGGHFLFLLPVVTGLVRPVVSEAGVRSIFSGWFLPGAWFLTLVLCVTIAWRMRMRRVDLLILVLISGAAYLASPRVWNALKPYQQQRVLSFLDPEADPQGASYHLRQAKIALGSGGLTGKGWAQGTQSGLRFLPEYQTDFVFSALGEQWGFVGTGLLLVLFFVFLTRAVLIARDARSSEGALLAAGIVVMFATHVAVNVGICLGFMPVTGLPLSFISYGGSSLLVNLMAVSLLLNIRLRRFA